MDFKCKDCQNYKAFEWTAEKGFCGKQIIKADLGACKHFEKAVKKID